MNKNLKTRPPLLSALCLLTFLGNTLGFISYFIASIFFEKTTELIIKYSAWHSAETISPFYFTTLMALFALSLIGAIRMWKLHRDGYFLYLIAQSLILFLPVAWINGQAFSMVNAIFTTIFILGYSLNWRNLK
ncbi:MAG: hypothetical protein HN778_19785 [Prolixibacteraceae bacterium]|jgi:hypothetical protein|nr:hypothetical protein [Prolixibacteraceae bacterium]MBT6996991.1 hypothetical protein [Prolixibacteraceae bacterium]MBT7397079.1 hypothetical protein [Prolixibacteraceae bacterium]